MPGIAFDMIRRAHHRAVRIAILAAAVAVASGCSTTGTWRVTRVEPEGAAFPIEWLTLDEAGRFTATGERESQRRTRTGMYRMRGGELRLAPGGGDEERYASRRLASGLWRLSPITDRKGTPVSATFRRVSE